MPYTPQTWQDNSAAHPLSAARMTVIEDAIENATALAESGGSGGITSVGMPGSGAPYIADNTTVGAQGAINSALTAVGTGGGVMLLPGVYSVKAPISLPPRTTLEGFGPHTSFIQTISGWSGTAMITNDFTNAGSVRHRIHGIGLESNNRAANGILLGINAAPTYYGPDPEPRIEACFISNTTGDGIAFGGTYSGRCREVKIHNCRIEHAVGWGMRMNASDGFVSMCSVQGCEAGGYYLEDGNGKITGSKAYSCGVTTGTFGPGFRLSSRAVCSGCESQDNIGNGFETWGPDVMIGSCTADSNGDGVTSSQSVGFLIGNDSCRISGASYQRSGGGATWKVAGAGQRHAVGYSGTRTRVVVSLVCGARPSPWVSDANGTAPTSSNIVII